MLRSWGSTPTASTKQKNMAELLAPPFYSLGMAYMHSFRFAKLWLLMGWVLVALIVVLSLWPKPLVVLSLWPKSPEMIGFGQSGKLSHILAYMTLMLWFANIYPQKVYQLRSTIAFFAMGVGLELLQGLTGYRIFKYTDMLANGIGILLALYLAKTSLATCLLHLDARLVRSN